MSEHEATDVKADSSLVPSEVAIALRHLAHTSDDVTWVYSKNLEVVHFVSDAYERVWGRSKESLRQSPRSWTENIHETDKERVLERVTECVTKGTSYRDEYRLVRPDGDVRFIRHRGFPLRDAAGELYGAAGIARDITAEHQAMAEANETARQMQLLAETAMAFVELPRDAPLYQLIGLKMHEIFGKETYLAVTELSTDEQTYELRTLLGFGNELDALRSLIGTELLFSGKMVPATREAWLSGRLVHFEGGMHALIDGLAPPEVAVKVEEALDIEAIYQIGFTRGGRVYGGVTVALKDATQLPKTELVEAFARQATVALERRESRLRLRASESQLLHAQKMEAIGRLAGGVAHDLNNRLSTIIGYGDALIAEIDEEATLRYDLQQILKAAEHATRLTEQLLAFGRKQIVQPRVLDVGRLIDDLEPMLERLIGEEYSVAAHCGVVSPTTRSDRGQLEQMILNLVINAREAMPRGGQIEIDVRRADVDEAAGRRLRLSPGPYVVISVADHGDGIEDEALQHIFEPFFTTRRDGQGGGLGLAMVYGSATQSGGTVHVKSSPGSGSVFRIYLPWVDAAAEPEELRQAKERDHTGATVLVAEDETLLRNLMVRVLQAKGYKVLAADDGERALEIVRTHEGVVDLLVSDVVMPRLGGRELAQQLLELNPRIKVLFTSGYLGSTATRQGGTLDESAFIAKPFTAAAFLSKVREVLDDEDVSASPA